MWRKETGPETAEASRKGAERRGGRGGGGGQKGGGRCR